MISKDRLWEIWGRINVPGVINFTPFQCGQIALVESLIEECGEDWMPIADAPKDRQILVWDIGYGKVTASWNEYLTVWVTVFGSRLERVTLYQELSGDPK